MSDTFEYITTQNQRWDQVAYLAYGVISLVRDDGTSYPAMQPIIEANPNVPIVDKLPAGTILNIPVIDSNTPKTNNALLPPWQYLTNDTATSHI